MLYILILLCMPDMYLAAHTINHMQVGQEGQATGCAV